MSVVRCVPMLALTATVTDSIRSHMSSSLGLAWSTVFSYLSHPTSVPRRSCEFEEYFTDVVKDLSRNSMKAKRLIVYCMFAYFYAHFLLTLGDTAISLPPGSPKLSDYTVSFDEGWVWDVKGDTRLSHVLQPLRSQTTLCLFCSDSDSYS